MASRFDLCLADAMAATLSLERALAARDNSDALAATCILRRCLGDLAVAAEPDKPARDQALAEITARSRPLLARAPVVTDRAWKQHARRA